MSHQETSTDRQIPTRPPTRQKFVEFAARTRRKLVDVADMAIDALLKQEHEPIDRVQSVRRERRRRVA